MNVNNPLIRDDTNPNNKLNTALIALQDYEYLHNTKRSLGSRSYTLENNDLALRLRSFNYILSYAYDKISDYDFF